MFMRKEQQIAYLVLKGQWSLFMAEPQNHLGVDRALFRNVLCLNPTLRDLNSVGRDPNYVFL